MLAVAKRALQRLPEARPSIGDLLTSLTHLLQRRSIKPTGDDLPLNVYGSTTAVIAMREVIEAVREFDVDMSALAFYEKQLLASTMSDERIINARDVQVIFDKCRELSEVASKFHVALAQCANRAFFGSEVHRSLRALRYADVMNDYLKNVGAAQARLNELSFDKKKKSLTKLGQKCDHMLGDKRSGSKSLAELLSGRPLDLRGATTLIFQFCDARP